jgi:hypothetical protein
LICSYNSAKSQYWRDSLPGAGLAPKPLSAHRESRSLIFIQGQSFRASGSRLP